MAKTLLMYGETGSMKSSNAADIVDYLYERWGVPVLGVFGDNRGPLQSQVNRGRLIPWDIYTHSDPLGCIIAASTGYWPVRLEDGRAVGPLKLRTGDAWNEISGFLVEGLTENGMLIMRDREMKRCSTGEPLVALTSELIAGTNETIHYAMGSRGTYQFAQIQTHRYVKNGFAKLPVPWVIMTAHESKGTDENGRPVYGPVIVGRAMIDTIPQWFDNTIHMDKYFFDVTVTGKDAKKTKTTIKRQGARAFFTGHVDAAIPTVFWAAKLGVPTDLMMEIFDAWPEGYVPLTLDRAGKYCSGVRDIIEMIDAHSDAQVRDDAENYDAGSSNASLDEAPAVDDAPVEQ